MPLCVVLLWCVPKGELEDPQTGVCCGDKAVNDRSLAIGLRMRSSHTDVAGVRPLFSDLLEDKCDRVLEPASCVFMAVLTPPTHDRNHACSATCSASKGQQPPVFGVECGASSLSLCGIGGRPCEIQAGGGDAPKM